MRLAMALAAAAACVVIVGCGDDDAGADGAQEARLHQTVTISGFRYHPADVQVLVGGSVTWINRDPKNDHTAETVNPHYLHTTGGERAAFDTHTLTWHEPYTVEFHKPGTYTYYCSFHAEMKGRVGVVLRKPPSQ